MEKIKEAISRIKGYLEHDSLFTDYEKDALPTLIQLVETVVALDGMVEKKKEAQQYIENKNSLKECVSIYMAHDMGFNEGVDTTIKAIAGRIQGLEKEVMEAWINYYKVAPDYKVHTSEKECIREVAQAIRKHIIGD